MADFDNWLCDWPGGRGHPFFIGSSLKGSVNFTRYVLPESGNNLLNEDNTYDCGYFICMFLVDLCIETNTNALDNFEELGEQLCYEDGTLFQRKRRVHLNYSPGSHICALSYTQGYDDRASNAVFR
jgi:hypothetical protein